MKNQNKQRKKRFSFSLLNLNCSRRIHKTWENDPIEVFPSEETDQGKIIHRYLAEVLRKDKKDWNFSRITSLIDIYGNPEKTFENIEGRFNTEKKIRIKMNGRIFTTVSDLLVSRTGERDIIDHKTGFGKEILPSYREQLYFYSLPFLREKLRVKLGVHFVRWSHIEWVDVLQGFDDYSAVAKELTEKINKTETILQGEPRPIESNYECKYCPYIISCPSRPKYLITDEKEAVALAGEYLKAKSRVKKMEQILKTWVNRVGNIRFNGSEVGYSPSTKTIIDDEATLEFLQANRIPITEIFVANAMKYKKLARQYGDLSSFCEIETGSRWGIKTIKGGETDGKW